MAIPGVMACVDGREFDVVVLGAGAAGLSAAATAAIKGASVVVFEKAAELGGTTAWSGGQVWVPNHPHLPSIGVTDSIEEARRYMLSLSRGMLDEQLLDVFLEKAPEMVEFLDAQVGTSFYPVPGFPDYHSENPGGKPEGGRTLECEMFSFHNLGGWAPLFRRSPYAHNEHIMMNESPLGAVKPAMPPPEEQARREENDERGRGPALVGRLFKGCLDADVEVYVSHRAMELECADGSVTGVRVATPDGEISVRARRGVVIATGGFEWNEQLVKTFLRGPLILPASPKENTGDGLIMAQRVGAMLGTMAEAWWTPMAALPEGVNELNRVLIQSERTKPRTIMVNRHGRRFTNEAANYNAFGGAFREEDVTAFEYSNLPCWMIFDQGYLRRYGTVGPWPAGEEPPPWLKGYATLEALADHLGIPSGALVQTVERWNQNVAQGVDPDFHRGESANDCWWGDPDYKLDPRGTLGSLDEAPYYAIEVTSGALGTKGGPKTDGNAQVIDVDGAVIPGLYAAGNAMASVFGMTYGGAGGTLGPALTFGYLAGKHLAER